MKEQLLLTILITSYNAQNTLEKAVKSALAYRDDYEIIICDDCSSDSTPALIARLEREGSNLRTLSLSQNSGGPSLPRNMGIQAARGEFIAFLDDDDQLEIESLFTMVEYAHEKKLDVLKGYLKVKENGRFTEANRLASLSKDNIMAQLIARQSTTIDIIVRRSFLSEHEIAFPADLKLGEDTVFYTRLFRHQPVTAYTDQSYYIYCKDTDALNRSTTQRYGDSEIANHISVWKQAEENLQAAGLSYYSLRLPVAIKNAVVSMVQYSYGHIGKEAFDLFCTFLLINHQYIHNKIFLSKRYQPVLAALNINDYTAFQQAIKPRLLIAGMDLKFISPILPFLEQHYHVCIDQWEGHHYSNEKESLAYLEWADILFCEWLLGNAVWYSAHKQPRQALIIRAHRFEVTRDFGFDVVWENVDILITVSVYFMELFARTFSIPREKMRLLSNYVQPEQYTGEKTEGYRKHLALSGMLPKTKGYHRALELLNLLVKRDPEFQLYLIGKQPEEVSWVMNQEDEKVYYAECDRYITEHGLAKHIHPTGWRDRKDIFRESGFVLSLSDAALPESFHLAPAEGITDGCIGLILSWPGAEYIYPAEMLCTGLDEMAETILHLSGDADAFTRLQRKLYDYIITNYPADKFYDGLHNILEQAYTKK